MKVNWRVGLKRLARVMAVVYGLISAVIVWFSFTGARDSASYMARQYGHEAEANAGVAEALIAALWCGVVFVGLYAAYRGARWVVLGFIDKP